MTDHSDQADVCAKPFSEHGIDVLNAVTTLFNGQAGFREILEAWLKDGHQECAGNYVALGALATVLFIQSHPTQASTDVLAQMFGQADFSMSAAWANVHGEPPQSPETD